ncbi:LysR family transcriptional regulator [Microbacterium sp. cx-55]|uniref:LysR family transcriptional regulator n=1 Tax=Microbacterium sp. cx-55 TaxID=2875948 RepID=UPI001CC0FBC7|nr:LysR family transcriptional regulator [Microbacterium sp. cx-55]MBZ4487771.1 LysR family transcriptional regulator [Microbacterium sp. cx-55]UGB34818.1 LysR family transcriptional regulator [Microbacterium sp. cx-55]
MEREDAVPEFDLNLLRPLLVLLEERSVTRAAVRLHLSQPATSAALARLRRQYDDDLLVRTGRTMQLTPFARDLLPAVAHAVAELRPVIDRKQSFDPAHTERRFVIGATDYMTAILAGPLLRTFAAEAPRASLDFAPQPLRDGTLAPFSQLDLIVGPVGFQLPGRSQELFTDEFVLIADPDNSVLGVPDPAIEMLSAVPHATAYLNDPDHDELQDLLRRAGIDYIVGARLFGLAALPLLVSGTDMVALVPRMLAAKASRTLHLAVLELPEQVRMPMMECMYWHPRDEDDPAILWLRNALSRTVPSLSREPSGPAPRRLRAATSD